MNTQLVMIALAQAGAVAAMLDDGDDDDVMIAPGDLEARAAVARGDDDEGDDDKPQFDELTNAELNVR
jgi:hypothetical protein